MINLFLITMKKENPKPLSEFESLLALLAAEKIECFAMFRTCLKGNSDTIEKGHFAHDFLDLLGFKLRESRCKLDKSLLASELFDLLSFAMKKVDFNPKFIASVGKTLVTFHRNHKDLDQAIVCLEFLIFHGISDADGEEFHIQLDELYRLRRKKSEKNGN